MTQDTSKVLRESADWRLLAMLFECPSESWRTQLAALANETELSDLRTAAELALSEATEGLYHSTYGPGGPAALREVSHLESVQLGQLLSELEICYDAFGYQPDGKEPPDHVAVEIGFIGYLRLKEAFAQSQNDGERASIAADAARDFMERHLSNLAVPLAKSLEHAGIEYAALAGRELARRVGPPKTAPAPLLPVLDTFESADDSSCCFPE